MRPRFAAAIALIAAAALPSSTASADHRGDTTIDLPAGFAGEGVTIGQRQHVLCRFSRRRAHRPRRPAPRHLRGVGVGSCRRPSRRGSSRPPSRSALGRRRADRPWPPPTTCGRCHRRSSAHADHRPSLHQRRRGDAFTVPTSPTAWRPSSTSSRLRVAIGGDGGDDRTQGQAAEFVPGFNLNGIDATRGRADTDRGQQRQR